MIKYKDIIFQRKKFVEREIKYKPLSVIKENIRNTKITADFKSAIQNKSDVSIISEFKPASPTKGDISNLLVEEIVPLYEFGGSSAISVLTEEYYFKSNIKNLNIASLITKLPILRKDFIMGEYQIYEARSCGANAVLLMADLYKDLSSGIDLCNYLEMNALVECKNREEIEKAAKAGAEIIGINNRSFEDFSIDFKRTEKLAKFIPENILLLSESGVNNGKDVKILGSYGADAILVGSSLMESSNIKEKLNELVNAGKDARLD